METSASKWEVVRESLINGAVSVCAMYDTKHDAVKYLDRLYFNKKRDGVHASWNREGDMLYIGIAAVYYCRPIENA